MTVETMISLDKFCLESYIKNLCFGNIYNKKKLLHKPEYFLKTGLYKCDELFGKKVINLDKLKFERKKRNEIRKIYFKEINYGWDRDKFCYDKNSTKSTYSKFNIVLKSLIIKNFCNWFIILMNVRNYKVLDSLFDYIIRLYDNSSNRRTA